MLLSLFDTIIPKNNHTKQNQCFFTSIVSQYPSVSHIVRNSFVQETTSSLMIHRIIGSEEVAVAVTDTETTTAINTEATITTAYVITQQHIQQKDGHPLEMVASFNCTEYTTQFLSFCMSHVKQLWDKMLQPSDLFLLLILGFGIVPCLATIYETIYPILTVNSKKGDKEGNRMSYRSSALYTIATLIGQLSRIAIVVYVVDFFVNLLSGLVLVDHDISIHLDKNVSKSIAKVLYMAWIANVIVAIKRHFLHKLFGLAVSTSFHSTSPNFHTTTTPTISSINSCTTSSNTTSRRTRLGYMSIIDRLINGIICLFTAAIAWEILDSELGLAKRIGLGVGSTNNLFTIGSITTVIIGLASRDVAAMLVNGLALSTSNRIVEGDDIRFGDGTTGVVHQIGWFQTTIRCYDNIMEIVPNNQLGMQRVKNISRTNQCRVQQTLRFHYQDALLLPKVLDDIIDEIKISCPDVVSDGSRPLRAVWTDYCETYLKVVVTAHFNNVKPIGRKFCKIRQQCLLAIYRAVQQNNIQFVTTMNLALPKNAKGKYATHEQDLASCG